MSKMTAESLLSAFPYALSRTEVYEILGSLAADELEELIEQKDFAKLYARIDELDSNILDILAKDFKIDWWDANAGIEAKRKTFASCIDIHKKLGTAGAVKNALTSMYEGAAVSEWFNYDGSPYHYKVDVDLGDGLGSSEKFNSIVSKSRTFANVRSVLDSVTFECTRTETCYVGCAIATGEKLTLRLGNT